MTVAAVFGLDEVVFILTGNYGGLRGKIFHKEFVNSNWAYGIFVTISREDWDKKKRKTRESLLANGAKINDDDTVDIPVYTVEGNITRTR